MFPLIWLGMNNFKSTICSKAGETTNRADSFDLMVFVLNNNNKMFIFERKSQVIARIGANQA